MSSSLIRSQVEMLKSKGDAQGIYNLVHNWGPLTIEEVEDLLINVCCDEKNNGDFDRKLNETYLEEYLQAYLRGLKRAKKYEEKYESYLHEENKKEEPSIADQFKVISQKLRDSLAKREETVSSIQNVKIVGQLEKLPNVNIKELMDIFDTFGLTPILHVQREDETLDSFLERTNKDIKDEVKMTEQERYQEIYKAYNGDKVIRSFVLNGDKAYADGWYVASNNCIRPPASFKEEIEQYAAFYIEFDGVKIPHWFLNYYPLP